MVTQADKQTMQKILSLLLSISFVFASQIFNVVDYGAIGDGKTLNTVPIVKAIQHASENGGIVLFPFDSKFIPTVYITGALNLSTNVFLEIDRDVTVRASDDPNDYACALSTTWDTGNCNYPLIGAFGQTNIGIIGEGTIDGGANSPPGHWVERYEPEYNFLVPMDIPLPSCAVGCGSCRIKLVVFQKCDGITLRDITLANSPLWTTVLVLSENILIERVKIIGDRRWPNNDGLDLIDCDNVNIFDSFISTGDDGICLCPHNTGNHNTNIHNCTIESTSAAIKFSQFDQHAFGDIENATIENLTVKDSNRGIDFLPRWGSGSIKNIKIKNASLETRFFSSNWWGNGEPIAVTALPLSATQAYSGSISDIENITGKSENGILIYGNHNIEKMQFSGLNITVEKFSNVSRQFGRDFRPSIFPDTTTVEQDPVNGVVVAYVAEMVFEGMVLLEEGNGLCFNRTESLFILHRDLDCN